MGNSSCFHTSSAKYKQDLTNRASIDIGKPPILENLSFFAQKGGDDSYFNSLEITYYSKNIENKMKDAQSQQERNLRFS